MFFNQISLYYLNVHPYDGWLSAVSETRKRYLAFVAPINKTRNIGCRRRRRRRRVLGPGCFWLPICVCLCVCVCVCVCFIIFSFNCFVYIISPPPPASRRAHFSCFGKTRFGAPKSFYGHGRNSKYAIRRILHRKLGLRVEFWPFPVLILRSCTRSTTDSF